MTPPADRMGECAPGKEALDALDRLDERAAGSGFSDEDAALIRSTVSALREEAEQLREERDAAVSACDKAIRERRSLEQKEDDWHSAYERAEAELARYREGLRETLQYLSNLNENADEALLRLRVDRAREVLLAASSPSPGDTDCEHDWIREHGSSGSYCARCGAGPVEVPGDTEGGQE